MNTLIKKLKDRFSETMIEDEIVAMNLENGDFFSLTQIGKEIWELIDVLPDRDAIVAALAKSYAAEASVVEADVDGFLAQLRGAGLIA